MVLERGLSRVCDDLHVVFEDVLSERLVLHRLLRTAFGDLFAAFLQAW